MRPSGSDRVALRMHQGQGQYFVLKDFSKKYIFEPHTQQDLCNQLSSLSYTSPLVADRDEQGGV